MFPKYPYLDLSDRNLDFLTKAIREMESEVKNFVSLNAVKYANPIQWSINRQYEKNTIVIDPLTGTAFISVQPVPNGVALTRTQYWTVVFDLSQFVTKAAQNFANSYERDITTTATIPTGAGDWVVWDSTLYVALTSIHAGDTYVVNGNIKRMTVEDFYDLLMEAIRRIDDRIDDEITNRQDADTALGGRIDGEIRDRQDADRALGGRIDGEIRDREDADTALSGRIDDDIRDRQDADDALGERIDVEIQNRIDADDELRRVISRSGQYVNVKAFGAIGDAKFYNKSDNTYYSDSNYTTPPTDDYGAIQTAIAYALANGIQSVYFPRGSYYCGQGTFTIGEDSVTFIGEAGSELISSGLTSGSFITISAGSNYISSTSLLTNIIIRGNYFKNDWTQDAVTGINFGSGSWTQGRSMDNIGVMFFNRGIYFEAATEFHLNDSKLILCDTAVYFGGSGSYNPMPAWFNNVTIELNGRGIFAEKDGYSTLFLNNCGLSGGSQLYLGYCDMKFTNCRMEFALHECCDKNGSPVPPIDFVGSSGASAISGLSFDNCQFLFTHEGVNAGKLIFWSGNVYTRTYELKYIIDNRNAYNDSCAPVTFNSCEILAGSAGCNCMVQQNENDFRLSFAQIKTPMSFNRCIAMGSNIMSSAELQHYSSNISYASNVYTVSSSTTITLNVPFNVTGISVHIEPRDNSVSLSINAKDKGGYSQVSASRTVPVNSDWSNQTLAIKNKQNVATVEITFGSGSFSAKQGEFWVEYLY